MFSLILPWLSPSTPAPVVDVPPPRPALHVALDARRLVDCLQANTVAPGRQWRTLSAMLRQTTLAPDRAGPAVAEAVRRGWIETGFVDQVCLTDLGRLSPPIELDDLLWPLVPQEQSGKNESENA